MKNLLIYISPTQSFDNPSRDLKINDAGVLVKIQIENSLALGWKKEDILLLTNFEWHYGNLRAVVINDVEFFKRKAQVSKINGIIKLFENHLIEDGELYWFHDLDAFQLEAIDPSEIKIREDQIGITDFGGAKFFRGEDRLSGGTIFFKNQSLDIFTRIKEICYRKQIDEEEALGRLIISDPKIRERVVKVNNTYNFVGSNLQNVYEKMIKPIKVVHFHPLEGKERLEGIGKESTLRFFSGENPLNTPLVTERLLKIFRFHRIGQKPEKTNVKKPKSNKFVIRNDDVSFDSEIDEIIRLCQMCDKYGYHLIHSIIPIGEHSKVTRRMTNDQIRSSSSRLFAENQEIVKYLLERNDSIGVHGLWHTHKPSAIEIKTAKNILEGLGFDPTYFVPPFNEGDYPDEIEGLKISRLSQTKSERLEDFLENGVPKGEVMYLHSWRFNNKPHNFDVLEKLLYKLSLSYPIKLNLGCRERKIDGFHNLDKIFGWCFQDGLPQYKDSSVEAITISHALMFLSIPELEEFVKEMWRVLKDNGVVRITEDDTENPISDTYKTGCRGARPRCLTGPKMMREILKNTGFEVLAVDENTTNYIDQSLLQNYHGGAPRCFFIEGIKKTK